MKIGNILAAMMISIALILLFYVAVEQHNKNEECYKLHYQECLDCHSENLSYALCSGFCFEPREIDFDIYCSFHPKEGCEDIPHECVT